MFNIILSVRMKLLYFLLSGIILMTGCKDDDPLTAEEDHFEAVGVVIYDNSGELVFSIFEGETSDTLFAERGVLSESYSVKFYNEDKDVIDPPEEEHSLMEFDISDDTIVEVIQPQDEFGFQLRGISTGVTSIELFIKHEGHNDYRSGSIPVVVD